MIHRLINWGVSLFKKEEVKAKTENENAQNLNNEEASVISEETTETSQKTEKETVDELLKIQIPDYKPMSEEQKKEVFDSMMELAKETHENRLSGKYVDDIDILPITKVSDEAKKEILHVIKSDIIENINKPVVYDSMPMTRDVNTKNDNNTVSSTTTNKSSRRRKNKK